jgi:hypothetical protein
MDIEMESRFSPMALYWLCLPLKYNDGRLVEAAKLTWVEDEIVSRAGGLTAHPTCIGMDLRKDKTPRRELIKLIQVAAQPGRETEKWFTDLGTRILTVFDQDEVFILVQSAWILGPSDKDNGLLIPTRVSIAAP